MPGRTDALDAAVAALAASGLAGWALVDEARLTVTRRFEEYSCLSWWESPRAAFAAAADTACSTTARCAPS